MHVLMHSSMLLIIRQLQLSTPFDLHFINEAEHFSKVYWSQSWLMFLLGSLSFYLTRRSMLRKQNSNPSSVLANLF